jgi:anti-sigma regulatory factor (Ser/Thr protein kinase)
MSTHHAEPGPAAHVHHRWPANPTQAARVRKEMRQWLLSSRYSAEQTDEILLAVSEAVQDTVQHAYPAGRPGGDHALDPARDVVHRGHRRGTGRNPEQGMAGMGLALMRSLVQSGVINISPDGARVLLGHPLPAGSHVLGLRRPRKIHPTTRISSEQAVARHVSGAERTSKIDEDKSAEQGGIVTRAVHRR